MDTVCIAVLSISDLELIKRDKNSAIQMSAYVAIFNGIVKMYSKQTGQLVSLSKGKLALAT